MQVSLASLSSVWSLSIFGGPPRKLWTSGYGAAVSPDGTAIAHFSGDGHEIWITGAGGENPRKMLESKNGKYIALAWSSTGDHLAYSMETDKGGKIETIPVAGGTPRTVISAPGLGGQYPNLVWLHDGGLVFTMAEPENPFGNLYQIRVDPSTGMPSGEHARITNWQGEGATWPSATNDGKHLLVIKWRQWEDIYIADLKADGATRVTARRLTLSRSHDRPTGWSHDDASVFFGSNRTGRNQI